MDRPAPYGVFIGLVPFWDGGTGAPSLHPSVEFNQLNLKTFKSKVKTMTDQVEITMNEAAKTVLMNAKNLIVGALSDVNSVDDTKASAGQVLARTMYQALTANKGNIENGQVIAYLNITADNDVKKLKQYASIGRFVWKNKDTPYVVENETRNVPHDVIIDSEQAAPSLSTIRKHITAYEKEVQAAQDARAQAMAMDMQAAQEYIDSGVALPDNVECAEDLLMGAKFDQSIGEALEAARKTHSERIASDLQAQRIADILTECDNLLQELAIIGSDAASDAAQAIVESATAIPALIQELRKAG